MSELSHNILVVSNPRDRTGIIDPLVRAGFQDIDTSDGSDDTLSLYEGSQPDVVVICANLERGDARDLIAALRASPHGEVARIILIGDGRGPIRTALDASDLAVDRFLGRPLSAKALLFSVRTCAEAASNLRAGRSHPTLPLPPIQPVAADTAGSEFRLPQPAQARRRNGRNTALQFSASAGGRRRANRTTGPYGSAAGGYGNGARSYGNAGGSYGNATGARRRARRTTGPYGHTAGRVYGSAAGSPHGGRSRARQSSPGSTLATPAWQEPTVILPKRRGDQETTAVGVPLPPVQLQPGGAPYPETSRPESSKKEWRGPDTVPMPGLANPGGEPPPGNPLQRGAALAADAETAGNGFDGEPPPGNPLQRGAALAADAEITSNADAEPPPGYPFEASSERTSGVGTESEESAGNGASNGDFARALQRKMAEMAERLFPDAHARTAARIDSPTRIPEELGARDAAAVIGTSIVSKADTNTEVAGQTGAAATSDSSATATGDSGASATGALGAAATRASGATATGASGPDVVGDSGPGVGGDSGPSAAGEAGGGRVLVAGALRRGESDAAVLLERVYRQRFSGQVVFRRNDVEKCIFFDRGRPVFAASNMPGDRMGELLQREGKVTDNQLGLGHRAATESGRRIGETLVAMGYLKRRELHPVVRRQLEEVIYSLFSWSDGEYEVIRGNAVADERIRLTRHPSAMILEGVRRKFARDELVALVGDISAVVAVIDDRQLKAVMSVAELSPAERKAIAAFDGERTLGEVAERASIGLLPVYQLAYGLIVLRAAHVARRQEQVARAQSAAWSEEPADVAAPDLNVDRQRILAKLSLVSESDYFRLLGVRRDATNFEIQRAYEVARCDYATEGFAPEVRQEFGSEIAEINEMLDEAFCVLRDDALRNSYLAHLRD